MTNEDWTTSDDEYGDSDECDIYGDEDSTRSEEDEEEDYYQDALEDKYIKLYVHSLRRTIHQERRVLKTLCPKQSPDYNTLKLFRRSSHNLTHPAANPLNLIWSAIQNCMRALMSIEFDPKYLRKLHLPNPPPIPAFRIVEILTAIQYLIKQDFRNTRLYGYTYQEIWMFLMPNCSDSPKAMRALQRQLHNTFKQIQEFNIVIQLENTSLKQSTVMTARDHPGPSSQYVLFSSSAEGDANSNKLKNQSVGNHCLMRTKKDSIKLCKDAEITRKETRGPYGDHNIMIPIEWFPKEEDSDDEAAEEASDMR